MVTKAEAVHNGSEFGKAYHDGHIANEAMAKFGASLRDAEKSDPTHRMQWAELSAATKELETQHVLPSLGLEDNHKVARVIGMTADSGKPDSERDTVVALGHKNGDHAKNVVVLGHDGKYYQAQAVDGGFVKTDKVVAENADELASKYKSGKLDEPLPKGEAKPEHKQETKITHEPNTGNVTSVRDASGHERRFKYDDNGKLDEMTIDGQRYSVTDGGSIESNDGNTRTAQVDKSGRLVINQYDDNNAVVRQDIINTDGTIDECRNGKWTHLSGHQQVNEVYADLHRNMKPQE